jgi:DNA-binding SARP family transcriptional activator
MSNKAPVLHLFDGPFVTIEEHRMEVPEGSKRLLVFVALRGGRIERKSAAGALWPAGDDIRAAGNLRSALWRLRSAGVDLLTTDKWSLKLHADVVVDVRLISDWATRLIRDTATDADLSMLPPTADALDLLPGWYDDWILVERERMRQRTLHALEALTRRLIRAGRCAEAVEAALLAVSAEPLRESAQRVLIDAHLAEGNWIEGWRAYEAYRALLSRELGAEPPPDLSMRIRSARRHTFVEAGV